MPRSGAVWGIDIGQCALKAMKCRAHDDPDKIVVEAFDYIEYPKVLSQPDANPVELIADALKQFLSRNQVHNDRVAVSVSGQSGLARFIKLPPVEAKKIPDIVRYEARQQIPFDLNDVIWDYQRMGGGSEESGFVLETEIGLFAMKRDAVFRALEPFVKAGIEVDIVQLAPLSLYNYVVFDLLQDLPSPEDYDPDDPPESIVLISLGTDATDLVVTNGFKVWQRSVPLGGSHFTKALTKEMKLTFAKAEHLKRNADTAQDPKAVIKAMKMVFHDLQTELQRSLSFFTNLDRTAKIGRVVAMGNAFKLPGLRRYLKESLGFEIERVDSFRGLVGPEVVVNPAFKENILSFGVCYGLCLQALNSSSAGLRTNLLPKEISLDRLIRRKKPWAVAAAAIVLLACTISYTAYSMQFRPVREEIWKPVEGQATNVQTQSTNLKRFYGEATKAFDALNAKGERLVSNLQYRDRWLKFLIELGKCLPRDSGPLPSSLDLEVLKSQIMHRNQLLVTNIDSQQVEDVAKWFQAVKPSYKALSVPGSSPPVYLPGTPFLGDSAPAPGGAVVPGAPAGAAAAGEGPSGPGTIVQIYGRHHHNARDEKDTTGQYVLNTLIANLASERMHRLGVSYPVLVTDEQPEKEDVVIPAQKRSDSSRTAESRQPGFNAAPAVESAGTDNEVKKVMVDRYRFRVQFVWQPKAAGAVAPVPLAGMIRTATASKTPPPPAGSTAPPPAAVAPAGAPASAVSPAAGRAPAAVVPSVPPPAAQVVPGLPTGPVAPPALPRRLPYQPANHP